MPKSSRKKIMSLSELMEGMLYNAKAYMTAGSIDFALVDLELDEDEVAEIVAVKFGMNFDSGIAQDTLIEFFQYCALIDDPNYSGLSDYSFADDNIIVEDQWGLIHWQDAGYAAGNIISHGELQPFSGLIPIGRGGSETRGWITARNVSFAQHVEWTGSALPSGAQVTCQVHYYKHRVQASEALTLFKRS